MSAPKTLMTWRINSALNCDVSIYSLFFFFFANGGLCESLVSRPWRRFPSILTQNSLGSEINELFFLRVCRVQLNRWRFFGKNGRVITHSAAWLRFLNIRQPKTSHFCPSVVVGHCFYWPSWTDWQGGLGKQAVKRAGAAVPEWAAAFLDFSVKGVKWELFDTDRWWQDS